jgi:galactitol-specific phosphotransferase system IIB component
MQATTKILVYSHGICVIPKDFAVKRVLLAYCYGMAQWEIVKSPPDWKPRREMKRVFAGATKDRREFRFHRNQLDDLLLHFEASGIRRNQIEIDYLPVPAGKEVDFTDNLLPEPREGQPRIIDHLAQPDEPIKITNMQTGKGKTYTALSAMARIGRRTVVQLRGGYVDRWIDDIVPLFKFKKRGDLLVVRGRDALISIINQAKNKDLDAKIIIITSKTLYAFLQEYENNPEENIYGIRPEELYDLLEVGLRIIDEVHEDYHLNFRSDIYCNIRSTIYLSATLITDDPFRRRMYDIALPADKWVALDYDAYVVAQAMMHGMYKPGSVQTTMRGRDSYSHGAYEQSILKNKTLLDNYLKIIERSFSEDFFVTTPYERGQKAIIFCYLTDMCAVVAKYLKRRFTDLDIEVYISETDSSVLKTADIIVSTVESAGTAQDIKGLKVVSLTRAMNKLEKNEQVKGRLRKMSGDWATIDPILNYLVNYTVPKHVEYHENKMTQWKGKVKDHKVLYLDEKL